MLKDSKQKTSEVKIDPEILILELSELYPEVVDFLIQEYEFHCVGCIMAGFESLRQGAEAHGIVGEDFDEMCKRINAIINAPKDPNKA